MKARDCIFLVADSHMQAVFTTFLSLPRCCDKLGTGSFRFDAERDLIKAGNDVEVYQHAHNLLRGYQTTYCNAVIVLDFEFGHHEDPDAIVASIRRNMVRTGWEVSRFEVVLIQPELEIWIWQDNPHIQEVFYSQLSQVERERLPPLRTWLRDQNLWPDDRPKPPDPKAAVEKAQKTFRAGSPMAIYTKICSRVSLHGCQDQAFLCLRDALQRWYPPGGNRL